jgi:hypothetical protein
VKSRKDQKGIIIRNEEKHVTKYVEDDKSGHPIDIEFVLIDNK